MIQKLGKYFTLEKCRISNEYIELRWEMIMEKQDVCFTLFKSMSNV